MSHPTKNRCALITASFVLLLTLAAAAQAAPDHQVILELELEGASCPGASVASPVSLVTVSSQSCDLAVLIDELETELEAAGFAGSTFCAEITGPTPTLDDFQCFWPIPAGCEQVRERLVLETGTECAGDALRGETQRPLPLGASDTFSIITIALP